MLAGRPARVSFVLLLLAAPAAAEPAADPPPAPARAETGTGAPRPKAGPEAEAEPPAERGPPADGPNVVAWSFAAGAGVALVTGVVFEIVGYGEYKEVEDSGCRPRCGRREDPGRLKMLVGDVLLGVGLVSAAAAAYFFLTGTGHARPPAPKAAALRVDARLAPAGGVVELGGTF